MKGRSIKSGDLITLRAGLDGQPASMKGRPIQSGDIYGGGPSVSPQLLR